MTLLPVALAQERLLAQTAPLPSERLPLLRAQGRWLAEPMQALRDQPWADISAMDGYAIRFADLPGPWTITGASRAGGQPVERVIGSGEAVRIFTGAPLPPGADTVLVQEDASCSDDRLTLTGEGPDSVTRHVRHRAADFASGTVLLPAGTRIGPRQIALAAAAGHDMLTVHAAPRIAIFSTGDELVAPGAPLTPGRQPASNGVMIAAMLAHLGCDIVDAGIVPDRLDRITDTLMANSGSDIMITTGGASVGDHDLVRPALNAAGGTIDFWRIAMRPGKPLIVGSLGAASFLGLPGNPVSAYVTTMLFVLPLVRHMMGAPDPLPPVMTLPTAITLPPGGQRTEYRRVLVQDGQVTALTDRDSAALSALCAANALLIRPTDAPATHPGGMVAVMMLD